MDFLVLGWAGIIAFCVIMYVILDGFTLGTGLMLPFIKDQHERSLMFSAILPTWDGNQTWLVLSGAALYGTFPSAFSTILPTLYLPLTLMVVSLLFRGVCFEFRLKAQAHIINRWDGLFFFGSLFATFIQGIVLGTFVSGFSGTMEGTTIPAYNWLTPFSLFTGIALVSGYLLLGSTRMVMKTEGDLQKRVNMIARTALILVALFMLIVSLWTPFTNPIIKMKWFGAANSGVMVAFPIICLIAFISCMIALVKNNDRLPFYAAIVIFICSYLGFAYSVYPYIVPYQLTIWKAAADHHSLAFTMFGAIIMLPVLLIYTGYSYKKFSGKVKDVIQY